VDINSYRQKDHAMIIYGHGFQTENIRQKAGELKLLALYLRDECGLKGKEIEEYVTNFCETYSSDYHFRTYYRMIGNACKHAEDQSNVLIQIDKLPVYQAEVEYINSLDLPYEQKKLMFSILMMKKLDKECYEQRQGGEYKMGYFPADDSKLRFLKKTAGLTKVDIPKDIFFHWRESGIIRVSYAGFILDFMDQMPHDGLEIMSVEHFDCFGLYWDLLFNGSKMETCKMCGKPFHKTSGNQTYCREHRATRKTAQLHKTIQVVCEKCGKDFYVSAHAARAKICPRCSREGKCRAISNQEWADWGKPVDDKK